MFRAVLYDWTGLGRAHLPPKGPQYRPFVFFPQTGMSCRLVPPAIMEPAVERPASSRRYAAGELIDMRSLHSLCRACVLRRDGQLVAVTARENGSRQVRSIRFLPFIFFISNNLFCHHSIFNLDACLDCIFIPSYLMLQSFADLSAWSPGLLPPFLVRR
ncbi:hypothetical protein PVAP13_8NG158302 [Panicum virgatum]|uniref:Uncharacterized protein n=1 Tax=Panicum virgatum TaxID=38727 RepID=A0A8T0P8F7_PANVG|nr:hypothetical protein PVAP13_8NG158302 [Panicum virgatum]